MLFILEDERKTTVGHTCSLILQLQCMPTGGTQFDIIPKTVLNVKSYVATIELHSHILMLYIFDNYLL
jgi:hypothetical protein